jgi:ribosome modulation factor
MSDRDEAGVVRERIDAAKRWLMAWDRKPLGVQASMDLTGSQGSPDLNVHELKAVDAEGFEAGRTGKKRERNPYTPGTEAAQRWDSAWLRGQGEAVERLGKPAPSTPASGERRGRGRPPGSKNKPKLEVHEGGGGQQQPEGDASGDKPADEREDKDTTVH